MSPRDPSQLIRVTMQDDNRLFYFLLGMAVLVAVVAMKLYR